MPDNAHVTWRFLLRRALPRDSLKGLKFALFGLGDSGYDKYNAAARKLRIRLLQLGASEVVERGFGDDQSAKGAWGDLDPWAALLWKCLEELHPWPPGYTPDDTPIKTLPLYTCREGDEVQGRSKTTTEDCEFYKRLRPLDAYNKGPLPFKATLRENKRLTASGHTQDVRHIVLDIKDIEGKGGVKAGDVAVVHPMNTAASAKELADLLGVDLDAMIKSLWRHLQLCIALRYLGSWVGAHVLPLISTALGLKVAVELSERGRQQQAPLDLPHHTAVRDLFMSYLDIQGRPSRMFFERLSVHATNEEEREKLLELSSQEGADLLQEYAVREKRSYVEVLREFPSCRPTLAYILELVPRLRPRHFSLASSPTAHADEAHLCVAVVAFLTPYKRRRFGVCSSWLAGLQPGASVRIWIKPGTLAVPKDVNHPIIMIGPGTGVAPMRSIATERSCLRAGQSTNQQPRDMFFFGCRYRLKDFLYQDEWETIKGLELHTAFSRDQATKVYVQHRIKEEGARVSSLVLEHQAYVLVSGSAKHMPSDVRSAIKEVLHEHGRLDLEACEKLLRDLELKKRYCVEAWS
ncbi:unnamed protein product [Chrysoparadoxa australica]